MSETVDTAINTENSEKPIAKKIGVPKEVFEGECRVAATPETAKKLQKMGFEVLIEKGAGANANFPDELFEKADCKIIADEKTLFKQSDIILKVRPPKDSEIVLLPENTTLISFINAAANPETVKQLEQKNTTVIAMEAIPRISRAQKMDALSSMANIAGYRAVIEAANNFGSFFTGQITAAGKIPPAESFGYRCWRCGTCGNWCGTQFRCDCSCF